MKYDIYIGIDTGTNTGVAVWDSIDKKFLLLRSMNIIEAFEQLQNYHPSSTHHSVMVLVEDARLKKLPKKYQRSGTAANQGVGSVKRDAQIFETFLKHYCFNYRMQQSRNTKVDAAMFKKITGFTGSTNSHSRDAGMIVYGL